MANTSRGSFGVDFRTYSDALDERIEFSKQDLRQAALAVCSVLEDRLAVEEILNMLGLK